MAKKKSDKLTVNANFKEFKGDAFKQVTVDGLNIKFKSSSYPRYGWGTQNDLEFSDNGKKIKAHVSANLAKGLDNARTTALALAKVGKKDPTVHCYVNGNIAGVSGAFISYDKYSKFSTVVNDFKKPELKAFAQRAEFRFGDYGTYEVVIDTTPEQKAAYDAYVARKAEEDRKYEERRKKQEAKWAKEEEARKKKIAEAEAEKKRKAEIQKKLAETEDLALALSILESKGLQVVVVKDGTQVV